MLDRLSSIAGILKEHGQEHLLAFRDEIGAARLDALLDQIEEIDFSTLDTLVAACMNRSETPVPADLVPAPAYPHIPPDAARYRETGRELVRSGKVAVFLVAGGQATRLGWNGPKGTYPGTVVTGKPLFRVLAEQVVANRDRYGVSIPLYIMTSPPNDAVTRAFFQDNNYFGLNRRNVFMFPQRMLPTIDAATGRLLLADKGTVAMNPDGHGGAIRALAESGAIEDMAARRIEQISYCQIDNPLVKVIDPLFLGLHAAAPDSSGDISSKMVRKSHPDEKVGVFCRSLGRTVVIEYVDLPPHLAAERDGGGRLRFDAGSIAVHSISVAFLRKLASGDGLSLPLHTARRAVPCVDPATGRRVAPAEPNAIKPETFLFDVLPLAASSIVYETSRVEEFAPIKNATGEDSPATSHRLQSDRAGAWLEAHGVTVPRDPDGGVSARIEISPLTALESADLARARLPKAIRRGESVVL